MSSQLTSSLLVGAAWVILSDHPRGRFCWSSAFRLSSHSELKRRLTTEAQRHREMNDQLKNDQLKPVDRVFLTIVSVAVLAVLGFGSWYVTNLVLILSK